ncbi:MAG: sugar phosphate isomerase/epimerase [Planctomycetota bacterium]
MNRRELLASAAGLSFLADRATAAREPDPREPERARDTRPSARTYSKAVKIGMVAAGSTLAEKFAILKRAGFDGVELDSPSGLDLDEVLAAKKETGLEIPGVVDSAHWQKPLSDPDASVRAEGLKALRKAMTDCKACGGTSVLLVPAVVTKKVPYWDAWWRSQQEIRKVLPLAAELEVRILIENVWNRFLLGPTELARYVDELASPWVGIHFDAGNLVQFGYPEHWVPILGHRIHKVDVKDYVRGKANYDGFGVKLNEGETDWPAVVAALRAIGYRGWFTAEMAGGDEAYLADLASRMDRFLA